MSPADTLLVVNPKSGGGAADAEARIEHLLGSRLAARGRRLDRISLGRRSWKKRLHRGLDRGASQIFVAGGDGSVLAVVSALDGRPVPLGIIPCGTMNWLARDLGIPQGPSEAIDALLDAPARAIDAGSVNGRPFLCACMIGLSPLLARWRERERGASPWRLWPKMLWIFLGVIQRYRHLRIALLTGDRVTHIKSHTVVVTNNLVGESLGPMPLRDRLDAGLLGLYAVREASKGELARLGTRLLLGSWQRDDAVLATAAAEVKLRVASRRSLTVMLDGERTRLRSPLAFAVRPGAVQVLTPPGSAPAPPPT